MMKTAVKDGKLTISGLENLTAHSAEYIRHGVQSAFRSEHARHIVFDLADTEKIDCCGIGVLVGCFKLAERSQGTFALENPTPQIQQMLELCRMHRIFQIRITARPEGCATVGTDK